MRIHDSLIIFGSSEELWMFCLIQREHRFYDNITNLCSKANQKLSANQNLRLSVSKFRSILKRCLLMSSYITSPFNYCSLECMIHNRQFHCKINKIHERALRIIYDNHEISLSELSNRDI